jgi:hypothetical protein
MLHASPTAELVLAYQNKTVEIDHVVRSGVLVGGFNVGW